MPINISSDSLIPIEEHFRVSAGPGAGKTHWLTQHIKNVLHNSTRLGKSRKVACITYNNVAVETILNRLNNSSDQVEVSTIHSFLYKHIIKPYASFISEEYGINVSAIDGHDEKIISFSFVRHWIENHPNYSMLRPPYTPSQLTKLPDYKQALINWLSSINYQFDQAGVLIIKADRQDAFYFDKNNSRKYMGKACLDQLEEHLLEFKKLYWREGTLHHEDVLFLSYQLIDKFPFILQVLRAKFPYFFIDEFQDTNPIQTKILEKIGQLDTVVGIIGDKAQSIYGFQGATPEHFDSFNLKSINDFVIADNRRSTNQIIDCLDSIRKNDMRQNKINNRDGEKPTIIIGDMIQAVNKAKELSNGEDVFSLTRKNITSNAIKRGMNSNIPNLNLFNSLYNADSNSERRRLITSCVKSIELSRHGQFKDAIKELDQIFSKKSDDSKRNILKHLIFLLDNYDSYNEDKLSSLHLLIKNNIDHNISDLRSGAAKVFYDDHTYYELAVCVKITEDTSYHRTIHKAKGAEFDNVIVVFDGESDLQFLLKPDLKKSESHRINYVAASRAKERLFFTVPTLDFVTKNKLANNFIIIEL